MKDPDAKFGSRLIINLHWNTTTGGKKKKKKSRGVGILTKRPIGAVCKGLEIRSLKNPHGMNEIYKKKIWGNGWENKRTKETHMKIFLRKRKRERETQQCKKQ